MTDSGAAIIPLPVGPKRAAAELRARTDDELMRLAAGGLPEAFDELVARHAGCVRAFCSRMMGGSARGDDVAQEVFLEIWRTRTRYQPQSRFRAYLFTAARNRCLRAIRDLRPRPQPADEALDEALDAADTALDALLEAERRRRVAGHVEQLSPKLREAIWLRFSADLDFNEVARVARCPVETARSRVFLGLQRLRKLLGDEERRQP
jgi:RNA polymerase sigma-70 factor (ECF subfamily)